MLPPDEFVHGRSVAGHSYSGLVWAQLACDCWVLEAAVAEFAELVVPFELAAGGWLSP